MDFIGLLASIIGFIAKFIGMAKGKTPEQKTIEVQNEEIKVLTNPDKPTATSSLHDGSF